VSEQIDLERWLSTRPPTATAEVAPDPVPPEEAAATFRCATCGAVVGVEDGASDDMPESCSACWVKAHQEPERAPIDFATAVGVASQGDRHAIIQGDCKLKLWWLKDDSIDACVTDPPYNLASIQKRFGGNNAAAKEPRFERLTRGFMGKTWDSEVAFDPATWVEVLRVMKPGAHLLAFGGTRTYHRLMCAIEDAGFEIRDCLSWIYNTGFPKSHDLGEGRGTALKPAWEPIVLARKPFEGTTSACVAEHGTGGLNIDACRIDGGKRAPGYREEHIGAVHTDTTSFGKWKKISNGSNVDLGRWPANLLHDGSDEVLASFPNSAGQLATESSSSRKNQTVYGAMARGSMGREPRGDTGSATRFFHCAKASRADREEGCEDLPAQKQDESRNADQPSMNGGEGNAYNRGAAPRKNHHPTVKPTELMRYLCRLITPPGGIVLDPFTGSGSTGKAAMLEGLRFIGCELEAAYVQIAAARIEAALRLTAVSSSGTPTAEESASNG